MSWSWLKHPKSWLAVLVLCALWTFGPACSDSGGTSSNLTECTRDADCGQAYRCGLDGRCEPRVPVGDEDEENGTDTDLDDDGASDNADVEPDTDQADTQDQDAESTEADCRYTSHFSCRNNTVDHDVLYCSTVSGKENQLWACKMICDTNPDCGCIIDESYLKTCADGCQANEDSQQNDFCVGEEPDGDEDGDMEDMDGDEEEVEYLNAHIGEPCGSDLDCLNGSCNKDWDGHGKYCVPDHDDCPFHVGEEFTSDTLAEYYDHSYVKCYNNSWKRCFSGSWNDSAVECRATPFCADGFYSPAQTCVSGDVSGQNRCQPNVDSEPCAGNLLCHDSMYCKSSCDENNDCAAGYICPSEGSNHCDPE